MFKVFKYFDWPLFAAVMLLALTGLLMIYSTGLGSSPESRLWIRQFLALALGLAGLFFLNGLDYRFFRKNSATLYVFSLLLLLGVLFLGQEIKGSRRWFDLGLFNFQPAELSKFALLVLLAKYLELKKSLLLKFRYVVWSLAYVAVPVILLSLQSDLGSAVVHLALWLGLLLLSPMPRHYFVYLLIVFLLISAVTWQFFLLDYQKARVGSFLDPTADPLGQGYNVRQAMVAIGSGGLFGSGLARGLQSQLKFLPERQTDFIFASTIEELGLIGGGLVLLLLMLVLWRMVRIMRQARDSFGAYLAAGILFLIFTQSAVNIGMNLGLLPVTGITLPFVSYGGSSLVITFWLIGIAENIARTSVPVRFG